SVAALGRLSHLLAKRLSVPPHERALAENALVLGAQRGHLIRLSGLRSLRRAQVASAVAHALERLPIAAVSRLHGPVVVAVEFHSGLPKREPGRSCPRPGFHQSLAVTVVRRRAPSNTAPD